MIIVCEVSKFIARSISNVTYISVLCAVNTVILSTLKAGAYFSLDIWISIYTCILLQYYTAAGIFCHPYHQVLNPVVGLVTENLVFLLVAFCENSFSCSVANQSEHRIRDSR